MKKILNIFSKENKKMFHYVRCLSLLVSFIFVTIIIGGIKAQAMSANELTYTYGAERDSEGYFSPTYSWMEFDYHTQTNGKCNVGMGRLSLYIKYEGYMNPGALDLDPTSQYCDATIEIYVDSTISEIDMSYTNNKNQGNYGWVEIPLVDEYYGLLKTIEVYSCPVVTLVTGVFCSNYYISFKDNHAPNMDDFWVYGHNYGDWTNTDITLTLYGAKDYYSGLAKYQYSYDKSTWYEDWDSGYTNKGTWSAERNQEVYFRACDNAGLCSAAIDDDVFIKIDKTKPTLASTTPTNSSGGNWTNAETVTVSYPKATDPVSNGVSSGIYKIQYSYDDSSWSNFSTQQSSSANASGSWSDERNSTVYARACDNAGNCVSYSTTYVKIDRTAPVLESAIPGNTSGGKWTNQKVTITYMKATDAASGYSKTQYSYNNSSWSNLSTQQTSTVLASGSWSDERNSTVYARACDVAGNCASYNTTYVKIDKTSPNAGSLGISSSNLWTNQDVVVTISGYSDPISNGVSSGVAKTQYNENGGTYVDFTNDTKTWSNEGEITVKSRVCDKAGNCSVASSPVYVKIDKTNPTIPSFYLYSRNSDSRSGYTNNTSVGISARAQDNLSGVVQYFTYNKNASGQYTGNYPSSSSPGSITVDSTNGLKTVGIRVVDAAGNYSDYKDATIYLDTVAPVITISQNIEDWSKTKIITITTSDPLQDNYRSTVFTTSVVYYKYSISTGYGRTYSQMVEDATDVCDISDGECTVSYNSGTGEYYFFVENIMDYAGNYSSYDYVTDFEYIEYYDMLWCDYHPDDTYNCDPNMNYTSREEYCYFNPTDRYNCVQTTVYCNKYPELCENGEAMFSIPEVADNYCKEWYYNNSNIDDVSHLCAIVDFDGKYEFYYQGYGSTSWAMSWLTILSSPYYSYYYELNYSEPWMGWENYCQMYASDSVYCIDGYQIGYYITTIDPTIYESIMENYCVGSYSYYSGCSPTNIRETRAMYCFENIGVSECEYPLWIDTGSNISYPEVAVSRDYYFYKYDKPIKLDNEKPIVSQGKITNANNGTWTNQTLIITFDGYVDNHSGIGEYYYKINSGEKIKTTTNAVTFSEDINATVVIVEICDKVGNCITLTASQQKSTQVKVDKTNPIIDTFIVGACTGRCDQSSAIKYTNKQDVVYTIIDSDPEINEASSGVYTYTVSDGATVINSLSQDKPTSGTISNSKTQHTITLTIKDAAGNVASKTYLITYDPDHSLVTSAVITNATMGTNEKSYVVGDVLNVTMVWHEPALHSVTANLPMTATPTPQSSTVDITTYLVIDISSFDVNFDAIRNVEIYIKDLACNVIKITFNFYRIDGSRDPQISSFNIRARGATANNYIGPKTVAGGYVAPVYNIANRSYLDTERMEFVVGQNGASDNFIHDEFIESGTEVRVTHSSSLSNKTVDQWYQMHNHASVEPAYIILYNIYGRGSMATINVTFDYVSPYLDIAVKDTDKTATLRYKDEIYITAANSRISNKYEYYMTSTDNLMSKKTYEDIPWLKGMEDDTSSDVKINISNGNYYLYVNVTKGSKDGAGNPVYANTIHSKYIDIGIPSYSDSSTYINEELINALDLGKYTAINAQDRVITLTLDKADPNLLNKKIDLALINSLLVGANYKIVAIDDSIAYEFSSNNTVFEKIFIAQANESGDSEENELFEFVVLISAPKTASEITKTAAITQGVSLEGFGVSFIDEENLIIERLITLDGVRVKEIDTNKTGVYEVRTIARDDIGRDTIIDQTIVVEAKETNNIIEEIVEDATQIITEVIEEVEINEPVTRKVVETINHPVILETKDEKEDKKKKKEDEDDSDEDEENSKK